MLFDDLRPYRRHGEGVLLFFKVIPKSRRPGPMGLVIDQQGCCRLKIGLAAPPVDGAANQALIAWCSELLSIPKSSMSIAQGAAAREKTIWIPKPSTQALESLEMLTKL